jgi:catechol 2,3-dioxygenase-like lactoylglutathione lyase family enzyme
MAILAIDHINIRTADVPAASQFFADVLDMQIRETPGIPDLRQAAWMCDSEGRAVIHLATGEIRYPWEKSGDVANPGSGRIHHVAFKCSQYEAMRQRLVGLGMRFQEFAIPAVNLRQLFVEELNGITLELNFFGT